MHRVLESYVNDFSRNNGFDGREVFEKFELFVNYCIVTRFVSDRFDVVDITSSGGEVGIDGAAVIIGEDLVLSPDEAREKFDSRVKDVKVSYIFTQSKNSKKFKRNDILNFGDAVQDIISTENKISQDEWLEEVSEIHKIVIEYASKIRDGLPECHMFFATSGDWSKSKDDNLEATIQSVVENIKNLNYTQKPKLLPLGFTRLKDYWTATTSPVEASFPAAKHLDVPRMEDIQQAYLAVVKAREYVDHVLKGEEGRIKPGIFNQNVRHFLGTSNDVNEKMISSLKNTSKKNRFAILNNGVTIVSPEVKIMGSQVTIRDYQIVNGCQTSHVLHHSESDLDENVMVTVKIIEAESKEIVDEIVEATNSQTKIDDHQMYAIDSHVREIQDYFEAHIDDQEDRDKVYFERRSKEYNNTSIPNIRRFDIYLLAKVFAAMFLDRPHVSTAYAGQLFEGKSKSVFDPKYNCIAYYTSALAYYKVFLLFNNGEYIDRDFSKYKWQILTVMKYQVGGSSKIDWSNDGQVEAYCSKIIDQFQKPTSECAPAVKDAIAAIKPFHPASRDTRKTKAFTDDLVDAVSSSSD